MVGLALRPAIPNREKECQGAHHPRFSLVSSVQPLRRPSFCPTKEEVQSGPRTCSIIETKDPIRGENLLEHEDSSPALSWLTWALELASALSGSSGHIPFVFFHVLLELLAHAAPLLMLTCLSPCCSSTSDIRFSHPGGCHHPQARHRPTPLSLSSWTSRSTCAVPPVPATPGPPLKFNGPSLHDSHPLIPPVCFCPPFPNQLHLP